MEPDSQTIEPDLSFSEVRAGLLEAYAETEGLTMLVVVREYRHNTAFKHRIELDGLGPGDSILKDNICR